MSIIVGITGSIASGKTTLLKYMMEKDYPVFICDDHVKKLYKSADVIKQIKNLFPDTDLSNRKAFAKIIYSDPKKKKELELILHPLVRTAMNKFVEDHQNDHLIFLEVPLLFESGWHSNCDYSITLLCDAATREKRALERGIPADIFQAIDKAQMPEIEKKALASHSINTAGNLDKVASEFEAIVGKLEE